MQAQLERLQAELRQHSEGDVGWRLETGKAGEGIVRLAHKLDVSLIVMGTHDHGLLERLLVGSVSHFVVRHARRPVLLIPALR